MVIPEISDRVLALGQQDHQEITIPYGSPGPPHIRKDPGCRCREFELWRLEAKVSHIIHAHSVDGALDSVDVVGKPIRTGPLFFLSRPEERRRFERRGLNIANRQKERRAIGHGETAREWTVWCGPVPDRPTLGRGEVEIRIIDAGMTLER